MADIFVSYASEDRDRVRALVDVLEEHGWSVWWDRTLHAGPRFDLEIEKALDAARCVVVVWSCDAIKSDWVHGEASEGLRRGILVPAAFDSATPPLQFRRNQTARLFEWPGAPGELPMLIAGVKAVLSPGTKGVEIKKQPAPARSRFRLRYLLAVLLAVITLVSIVSFVYLTRTTSSASPSQAVLTAVFTFDVPEGDQAAAALANDIANETVDTMNEVGLPVIARRALASAGAHERNERAMTLGAAYAVDGDVRHESDQWLISVRIDALKSATTLWANSYRDGDGAATHLRTRVATEVVDTLRCASPDPHVRGWGGTSGVAPDDVDSLRLLMNVCAQMRGAASGDEIRTVFRTLAARYPDSAEISAKLAMHLTWGLFSTPVALRPALVDEAEQAARRAMALGPDLGGSYLAMVNVRDAQGAPGGEIGKIFEEGLRRDPEHATLNEFYGVFLEDLGRNAEAEPYSRRGAAHDPLSSAKQVVLADNLISLGRTAEAARILEDAWKRWQEAWIWDARIRYAVFDGVGDVDALLATPPDDLRSEEFGCWREFAAAMAVSNPDARRRDGIAVAARCDKADIGARIAFGDIDGAFELAQYVAGWGDPDHFLPAGNLQSSTLLTVQAKAMQRDPRFMPLMHKLGVLAIWQDTDHWPDFCQLPDLPYDCRAEGKQLRP